LLELSSKATLARAARTVAESYELVQHGSHTFIPCHWLTEAIGPLPAAERIWQPLTRNDKRRLANQTQNILFATDSELTNFDLMLRQFAIEDESVIQHLLVRTEDGLKMLDETGTLVEPTGQFCPNVLKPVLNTEEAAKAEVFDVIKGWLNSEEEAHSLLHHLATALCPGWSAVKYVLLIGDGRNGKSVLLSMLQDLFGASNVSNVTRQQIAERLPVCVELNNKLLNIIFDGEMAYIKDSSMEKTLIAGEPGYVRLLYENGNTRVQTNALFLEALNSEPKTRDKSGALQKRLSRFWFPNTYPIDMAFEKRMRSDELLGAFLSLLLDHFVTKYELADKLKQTSGSSALQVEQNLLNSPLHQFVSYLVSSDASWNDRLRQPVMVDPLVDSFMAWRVNEGFTEFSTADVKRLFKEGFSTDWKTVREAGKVVKKQRLLEPKPEILALLNQLKGADEDATDD
jgi:hypothetical protein